MGRKKNIPDYSKFSAPVYSVKDKPKNNSKSNKLMEGINTWASFYRSNMAIFVKEYFGVKLKIFQCILLYMMNENNYFMYLASRG